MGKEEPEYFDRLWAERQDLKRRHGDCSCDTCERVRDELREALLRDDDDIISERRSPWGRLSYD